MAESIQTVSIARETHERYLRYAMSVITSRALPDVRDGLKPVQRRILYTMFHDLRLHFDGRPLKCAKIVGDVMGNYHPHGDLAIYEALVRLAQSWVLLVPLVHGQGNFGSVDGDPPAAYRYTEAKLSAMADFLLRELRQQTVEMRPTYDSTKEEPVVLPAEFPNLLVNGSSGIAVGMATNIPPHNLGEVIRGCILLIDNPESTVAEIMQKIKGPDFPLGGKIITDRTTLRKIYEEGEGTIRIQGEWEVEGLDGKRPKIIITSIPYGVEKSKLENDIGAIIEDRKLPDLLGSANESNEKAGLRVALDIKPGADPAKIMAYLYKHTDLQQTFSYNLTCLAPSEEGKLLPHPKLNLKAILQHFLDFRLETVRKRFEYELAQLRKRIHLLEGFKIIFDGLDLAIKLIRNSEGKADAAKKLMANFELDDEQTMAILDSQLYKIAQLEIKKILDELEEKTKQAKEIEAILKSKKRLWDVVKNELGAIEDKYSTRRRTRMASDEDILEFDEEAYIVKENTNVVLTKDGWIKRVGRLAKIESTRTREGDQVIAVVPASTLDHVAFFADDGTAYTMRVNEVPASSGYGEPITKFFKLADQVKIIDVATTDERFVPEEIAGKRGDPKGPYLLAVTQQGLTLRTPFAAFRTASTKSGRRYVRLEENDKVVMAKVLTEEESLFLASANGHVIHFRIDQINVLSGAGKGVIGIKLDDGDICLGGATVSNRHDALTVETSGGLSKEFRRGAHPVVNRGGKGTEVVKRASLVRVIPNPIELVDWEAVDSGASTKASKAERNGTANGSEKNGDGHKSLFEE